MIKGLLKIFSAFLTLYVLSGCASVERYNKKREQPISIKRLQDDVDFVQSTLYRRHPDFDYYTPKTVLDHKFDSLRSAITRPMTMNEFYVHIGGVLAYVHQGHMAVLPAPRRVDKERRKYLRSMGASPLVQFDFLWEDEKLYVHRQRTDDSSIMPGWELIAINDLPVREVYAKYRPILTSDGYNHTALPMFFAKRIPLFYVEELGQVDSARYLFSDGEKQIEKLVRRKSKEKNEKQKEKELVPAPELAVNNAVDTAATDTFAQKEVAKTEEQLKKEKEQQKEEASRKYLHGYDKLRDEYVRQLKFYGADSGIAYLKIRQFGEGPYRKSYKAIFDSIHAVGSGVLVLDLRDNPGGRAAEVVDLNRYLSDTAFQMYTPAKVSSKTSLLNPGFYSAVPKLLWPVLSLYYPVYAVNKFVKTKKHEDGNYYYHGLNGVRTKDLHENAFRGKVYVLVNGSSFSAACLLSSKLSVLPNVTILGVETGGDFNGTVAGTLPMLNLPNSNIIWRVGLMHIRPTNRTDLKGRGIFPDIEMPEKAMDIVHKRDVIMDWILNVEKMELSMEN